MKTAPASANGAPPSVSPTIELSETALRSSAHAVLMFTSATRKDVATMYSHARRSVIVAV